MYSVVNKTERFDLSNNGHLERYDQILNDPTCQITREIREKISEKEIGDENQLIAIKEYLLLVVTYQKRVLL
jgi:hypothetical protein